MAAVALVACTGSKPLSNRAAKLDASGMYAEAAELYLQSVDRNPKNVDARIGLKKTGQMLLDDKLSNFFKAFNMQDDNEAAVNAYLEAESYQGRVQRAGVNLEIPESYQRDFKQVKEAYLMQLYDLGQELLAAQDYAMAQAVFDKIGKLEPDYKNASSLQDIAYTEPLYRAGKEALENGQYRKAYNNLLQVLERDAAYKDARELQQQAVERGQYPIAVLPFNRAGSSSSAGKAADLQARITAGIIALNDPFIRVVDRENTERILEEQRMGMTGVVDESSAVNAGKLMGAQAVIMGTVTDYREIPGRLQRSTKEGYESYLVKKLNPETGTTVLETRYRPVEYTEYYKENKASLAFSYKIVSLETGQVLLSRVLDRQAADEAYFAEYEGSAEALYPKRNGVVDTRAAARRELRALVAAPREVQTTAALGRAVTQAVSSAVAADIITELSTRLP